MSELTLQAAPILTEDDLVLAETRLHIVDTLDIVSIGFSSDETDHEQALHHSALARHLEQVAGFPAGRALPRTGRLCTSRLGHCLLGLQPALWFLVSPPATSGGNVLIDGVHTTEQSDAWVVVELEGPLTHRVLELCCSLDLHAASFGEEHVSRTVMAHLSVIIHRSGSTGLRLYSPRSTAQDFWHMLQTCLCSVAAEHRADEDR